MLTPLNGTKTHPLSKHAIAWLRVLDVEGPAPTQAINAGVVNRFHREALTETIRLPSPFKTHRGKMIDFQQITEAGREALADLT